MAESKLSPRRLEAIQKQESALGLRMAGRTWQEIADQLGYANHSGAIAAVNSALTRTLQEPVEHYRALNIERLTKVLQVNWRAMLGRDADATKFCLQAIEGINKILGLNAPSKVEHSGVGGEAIQHEVLTLDARNITDAIGALTEAGVLRLEPGRESTAIVDAIHTP